MINEGISKLNPENVERIYKYCFFKDDELEYDEKTGRKWPKNEEDMILTAGVYLSSGLNRQRVEEKREEINELIDLLPPGYKDGVSFHMLCLNKESGIWTGEQRFADILLNLGLAIGRMKFCEEKREHWVFLPGGLPYIYVFPKDNN